MCILALQLFNKKLSSLTAVYLFIAQNISNAINLSVFITEISNPEKIYKPNNKKKNNNLFGI